MKLSKYILHVSFESFKKDINTKVEDIDYIEYPQIERKLIEKTDRAVRKRDAQLWIINKSHWKEKN